MLWIIKNIWIKFKHAPLPPKKRAKALRAESGTQIKAIEYAQENLNFSHAYGASGEAEYWEKVLQYLEK